ncbi:MAG: 2-hydroxychromene-2-carboxylate isomerase [Xanthomonadales bacterium]|nr:2-hydroxychromene-2-carboxylate isomerase [Xanthomonadales bacterium]
MPATVDLFWSFRSPYSYLATPEALQLPERFDIELRFRPVLPLAVRQPGFFSPENLKRAKYILIDWPRRAEMLGLPHAWPSPDPIVQDLKTYEIADEQPYIYRLTWLGVEAERRGRGVPFAAEVSRLIFGGTEDWHVGDHLAKAAARAGLDLEQMDLAIADPKSHRMEVEGNQQDLEAAGHWGVPTFVFQGEPFFGQDRIETLCWRLDREGLTVDK